MAVSLDALLRLKAQVSGAPAVQGMSNALGGVRNAAAQATTSFKGLAAASGMGGLGGAMGALMPLLSVAGLAGMAKNSLDAGAAMHNLSQRTGVSVESLAKFKKAASTTGTDIDSVAKALVKMSAGLNTAATTGGGPAAASLKQLGISATDASGKVKNADAVLLEVANKFKAMPDGVGKTAAAIGLFGRSGAEMIPMLNMGGDAIDKLSVKMTAAFAEKADEYKDKLTALSGKVGGLGADLLIALLPALTVVTNAVTAGVDAFNKLPGPIRGIVVAIAGIAIAAPLISGALTAIGAGFTGLITILGSLGSGLAGIGTVLAVIFTGPVGWAALLIGAGVALYAFRDKIGGFLQWLFDTWIGTLKKIGTLFYDLVVKPKIAAAQAMWEMLRNGWTTFSGWVGGAFTAIGNLFGTYVVKPVVAAWNSIVNACKAPLNAILSFSGSVINAYIDMINGMIGKVNGITKSIGIPAIGIIPQVTVPRFAEGAFVTGPTYAQIGEGRDAEYVLPAGKVSGFINNYQAGARGASAIPTSSGGSSSGGGGGGGTFAPVFNLTTGPVLQRDGENWVTLRDAQLIARQSCEQLYAQLRTPAGRRSLGVKHG
jgi:hypothetical protein